MNDKLSKVGRPVLSWAAWRGYMTRKIGRRNAGFTIVETLIVLAVTGAMLLSAMTLIVGQQAKVQFSQSARDITSVIEQTINEVSAGYYPNLGTFRCTGTGGGVTLSNAPQEQGSNEGCIFLGKVMQFGVREGADMTDPQRYAIHSVAGVQNNTGTLASAFPKVIAPGSGDPASYPNVTIENPLKYGLNAVWMRYTNGGTTQDISAVGFISSLGGFDGSGKLLSGRQQVNLIPIGGTGSTPFGRSAEQVVDSVNSNLDDPLLSPISPSGGVEICFQGGRNQSGLVKIGSGGGNLSVQLTIKGTTDCS